MANITVILKNEETGEERAYGSYPEENFWVELVVGEDHLYELGRRRAHPIVNPNGEERLRLMAWKGREKPEDIREATDVFTWDLRREDDAAPADTPS